MRVSVIIRTRNEAEAIGRVLGDHRRNLVNEVIVIDNCSPTARRKLQDAWVL